MFWKKKEKKIPAPETPEKVDHVAQFYETLFEQNKTDYLLGKIDYETFEANLKEIAKAVQRNVERRCRAVEEYRSRADAQEV